ncbi:acyl-CoA carboxylase epsilon subunit [Streptomyces sp. NPDC003401]
MAERIADAVRVERGSADEAELAVVTVVLMAALAGQRAHPDGHARHTAPPPSAAPWHRWDRLAAYQPPHSWR